MLISLTLPRLILLLGVCALCPASAQTTTPATNAAPATPVVSPIALGDVVVQAEQVLTKLKEDRNDYITDPATQTVSSGLATLSQQIDKRLAGDGQLLNSSPSLSQLQNAQSAWQAITGALANAKKTMTDRANLIATRITELGQLASVWQVTQTSAKGAPPEALQRIKDVLAAIKETTGAVQANQARIVTVQGRLVAQDTRITNGLEALSKAQEAARARLFEQDHSPLWAASVSQLATTGMVEENVTFHNQLVGVRDYLRERVIAVYIQFLILVVLIFNFYAVRKSIRAQAKEEPALESAAQIFDVPLFTAIVITLLFSGWLYPIAPRLLSAGIVAVALVPSIVILRRLIEPALAPVLYAIVLAYFLDQLRNVLTPSGLFSRFLMVIELMVACLFLIWLLKSKRVMSALHSAWLERIIRLYIHVTLFVFLVAGFSNIFGYVTLATQLSDGMLKSSYLTVIFYAAARIIDAFAISVLSVRPLNKFRMVRRHRDLIYGKIAIGVNWIAVACWVLVALSLFAVRDPVWQGLITVVDTKIGWGVTKVTIGSVLAFGMTVWASFLISRFVRFALEEEVYPHLRLGRGIPYAASTMVHYIVLVIGFITALGALGIDLTQLTILAGAFGVGIGFGLQNIINNFVSGIILLFERPIKVGDSIQIDAATMGVVERIGIRASVIQLANGSEVILPNGNLISSPVTNWSLSHNRRVIEINVAVSSQADPAQVMALLVKIAAADSRVAKTPPPQPLLMTLAAASLTFRLRAWIDTDEDLLQVTSDLSLAINSALVAEKMTLA